MRAAAGFWREPLLRTALKSKYLQNTLTSGGAPSDFLPLTEQSEELAFRWGRSRAASSRFRLEGEEGEHGAGRPGGAVGSAACGLGVASPAVAAWPPLSSPRAAQRVPHADAHAVRVQNSRDSSLRCEPRGSGRAASAQVPGVWRTAPQRARWLTLQGVSGRAEWKETGCFSLTVSQ